MDPHQKVVLITGASSGIGLAAAHLFAARGARVALAARSGDVLEHLAAELPDALAVPTDVTDDAAVRQMVARAHAHYGRLDVLVNNAGRGMQAPVERVDPQAYRDLFGLNVVSALNAMQAAIPLMRAQGGGAIVNVSSGTTKAVLPGTGPYASTKHAMNSLSLVARAELEGDGIVVSLVHPFLTETNFGRNVIRFGEGGRPGGLPAGDTAEYAAGLILEAVETGAAEVYAERVRRGP